MYIYATRTASRCSTVFMVWLRAYYKVTMFYTVYQSEPVTMSIHLLCIPVGEKEPEFGRLLLGDLQPSSALSCEVPSLSRRFSSLCAAKVTATSLDVQNLHKRQTACYLKNNHYNNIYAGPVWVIITHTYFITIRFTGDIMVYWTVERIFPRSTFFKVYDLASMPICFVFINSF
jgi:hypothetical protein